MARRVQNHEGEDVNVPHTVNAGEESGRELELDVFVPLPLRFGDLPEDEADDGEEGADECGKHEELETVNDAFIMETAHLAHGREDAALNANVVKDLPHHVAEEEEVNGGGYGTEHDERHLMDMNVNRKL